MKQCLTLLLLTFLIPFLSANPGFAAEPAFRFVSEAPADTVFSPNLLAFALPYLERIGKADLLRVYRYDAALHEYVPSASVPMGTRTICRVNSDGSFVVTDSDRPGIHESYDARGRKVSESDTLPCTPSGLGALPVLSSEERSQLRSVLCSIPADEPLNIDPRHGATLSAETTAARARVYDLFQMLGTLPDGRIVAEIGTYPIVGDNVKYGRYHPSTLVTILLPKGRRNYCTQDSLSVSPEDGCALAAPVAVSPFLQTYTVSSSPAGSGCSFTLAEGNPWGQRSASTDVTVEWLKSEYESTAQVFSFRAKSFRGRPAATSFSLDVANGCGHIIRTRPANPKLRSSTFGINDLFCSHY